MKCLIYEMNKSHRKKVSGKKIDNLVKKSQFCEVLGQNVTGNKGCFPETLLAAPYYFREKSPRNLKLRTLFPMTFCPRTSQN